MSVLQPFHRRLSLIRAIGCFLVAIAVASVPLFAEVDGVGVAFLMIFAGCFLLISAFHFWQYRRTAGASSAVPTHQATVHAESRSLKRWLLATILFFPPATAIVAYELHRFESGTIDEIRLWVPVAAMYESLGYWPAVLVVPAIGVLGVLVFLNQLRSLPRQEADAASSEN